MGACKGFPELLDPVALLGSRGAPAETEMTR